MVRPAAFGFNAETAGSNAFQNRPGAAPAEVLAAARAEFDGFVAALRGRDIEVVVVEDTPAPLKPDALFPNNWVSFHEDGGVVLYPMAASNRRLERRAEALETLGRSFALGATWDLSPHEAKGEFLEGTGSMVLDHVHRRAYACLSPRTHEGLFKAWCARRGYEPAAFAAADARGQAVYHTNVLMSVGDGFAVACLDAVGDAAERRRLEVVLRDGLQLVAIGLEQMARFCGNVLEVESRSGTPHLVLSQTAFDAFTPAQRKTLSGYAELLPVSIPTIESVGGGSARCMLAEVFSPRRA
ncbi:MAG: amidinotransferase [Elusimicrobia bacterium]|nr:amidinotransferase [Elusimicrobiota bacterium]